MAELGNYKCSSCGGMLQFSSQKQMLVCTSCGSEFAVAQFNQTVMQQGETQYQEKKDEWNVREDGLVVYECKNCGGEVVGDSNMASTKCPYCDNPIVISSKFEGILRPDLVIPFKLDRKKAEAQLTNHINKVKLAPSAFKSGNHIKEMVGVYVPFWLYDADVFGHVNFEAIKEEKHSDAQYNYVDKHYYDVMREGYISFDNVPADASQKMDDNLMDSIEPYNVAEAVPYSSAYLAGYVADRYDVGPEQCEHRAFKRMEQTTKDMLKSKVQGYNTVTEKMANVQRVNERYKYALYPVWILNTVWNGQKFTFAMNGQTGKLVGDVPYSKGKFWGVLLGVFAVLAGIIMAIIQFAGSGLTPKGGIGASVVALIVALIVAFSLKGGTKSVHKGTKAQSFVRNGSFRITNYYDNFLRKTTERKPKNNQ